VHAGDSLQISSSGWFFKGRDSVKSPDDFSGSPDPQFGTAIIPDRASNALLGGIQQAPDLHFLYPLAQKGTSDLTPVLGNDVALDIN
jgi:hypothetical protein